MRASGSVKWFDDAKGYGFIRQFSGGGECFVHHSAILMSGHRTLTAGQTVEFDVGQGAKGPTAVNVIVTADAPYTPDAA